MLSSGLVGSGEANEKWRAHTSDRITSGSRSTRHVVSIRIWRNPESPSNYRSCEKTRRPKSTLLGGDACRVFRSGFYRLRVVQPAFAFSTRSLCENTYHTEHFFFFFFFNICSEIDHSREVDGFSTSPQRYCYCGTPPFLFVSDRDRVRYPRVEIVVSHVPFHNTAEPFGEHVQNNEFVFRFRSIR